MEDDKKIEGYKKHFKNKTREEILKEKDGLSRWGDRQKDRKG